MTAAFPAGFEWGTATAAHQIEGGNWNNDWWVWEHDPSSGCAEPSGDACDSYHRYGEDIALIAELPKAVVAAAREHLAARYTGVLGERLQLVVA